MILRTLTVTYTNIFKSCNKNESLTVLAQSMEWQRGWAVKIIHITIPIFYLSTLKGKWKHGEHQTGWWRRAKQRRTNVLENPDPVNKSRI